MSILRDIKSHLVDGQRLDDMIEYLAENGCDDPHELIAETLPSLIRDIRATGYGSTKWHLAARVDLYRKAVHINDYPAALKILQDLQQFMVAEEDPVDFLDMEARFERLER